MKNLLALLALLLLCAFARAEEVSTTLEI